MTDWERVWEGLQESTRKLLEDGSQQPDQCPADELAAVLEFPVPVESEDEDEPEGES